MRSVLVRSVGPLAFAAALLLALCGTAAAAPPQNDAFSSAIDVTGDQVAVDGTTEGATVEVGEPDLGALRSVWYRWHAARSGLVSVRCQGWDDLKVGVFTGSAVDDLEEVSSARSGCPDSRFSFRAAAGLDYAIAVAGEGTGGGFTLVVERSGDAPVNDDFANATQVIGDQGAIRVTTEGAGREPGEPWHAGSPFGSSVWLRWTAQRPGTTSIYPCEGTFHPVVEAFVGEAVGALSPLGQAVDGITGYGSCSLGGRGGIALPAVAGQSYAISIDGAGGLWGWADVLIREPSPPPGPSIAWVSPGIKIHGNRANLRFGSNHSDSTFRCRLDRRQWVPCRSPKVYKSLRVGRHRFAVVADNPTAGTSVPAIRFFRIRPVKRGPR
jgi:hypothetical protein